MANHAQWRGICSGLITSALVMWMPAGLAAPKLIWLMRDLPPLTVRDGAQKGQGIIDRLMPALMAGMPQYEHVILPVNRARAIRMLEDTSLACDPALVRNPARAQSIAYSRPVIDLHGNGLTIRRENKKLIEPFVHGDSVDLQAMLKAQTLKLGVIAKRSYGTWIDTQVSQGPADQLFIHYGNDPLGSLLHMQNAGRVQALLGYWPEIQSKARQQGLASESLIFYRIIGAPAYQPIHIGCSNTPEGREVIRRVNAILASREHQALNTSEGTWLEFGQVDDAQTSSPPSTTGQ